MLVLLLSDVVSVCFLSNICQCTCSLLYTLDPLPDQHKLFIPPHVYIDVWFTGVFLIEPVVLECSPPAAS